MGPLSSVQGKEGQGSGGLDSFSTTSASQPLGPHWRRNSGSSGSAVIWVAAGIGHIAAVLVPALTETCSIMGHPIAAFEIVYRFAASFQSHAVPIIGKTHSLFSIVSRQSMPQTDCNLVNDPV